MVSGLVTSGQEVCRACSFKSFGSSSGFAGAGVLQVLSFGTFRCLGLELWGVSGALAVMAFRFARHHDIKLAIV